MMLAWDHWHIEPSSICTLKCPRCPRAEVPESLLNRQLSLEFFQKQIGSDTVKSIRKITFCGNDGDPIYCRDFLDIVTWIKTVNPAMHVVIITNGSYKSRDWWKRLASVLDHRDEIHWSIDGWDPASNQQYRVNSDWLSIIDGIDSFCQHNQETYRIWATIAFRFNQNYLDDIKTLAKNKEFDAWQLTKSTKFGSHYPDAYGQDDPLCPEKSDLVSSSHRFERDVIALSTRTRPGQLLKEVFFQRAQDLAKHKQYSGICFIGNKGVFLDSQGRFFPCCWTANRYAHNQHWHQLAQTRFDLNTSTFEQILKDPFWSTDFLRFDSHECRTKCTAERLTDREHTTEW
jgi:MoaA/NifB/PqqE/SkfB family radical SAM enzyme